MKVGPFWTRYRKPQACAWACSDTSSLVAVEEPQYDIMLFLMPAATVMAAGGCYLVTHGPRKLKTGIRVDTSMELLADRCDIWL
jgi:hypothetical protein